MVREAGFSLQNLVRGLIVRTVEIVGCEYLAEDDVYERQLRNPIRLSNPLKHKCRQNPVWFYPFGKQ
jgi:hypothetical protein